MGFAAAMATAVDGYVEKMAFSVQAKRYEWMAALFERAGKQLRAILDRTQGVQRGAWQIPPM